MTPHPPSLSPVRIDKWLWAVRIFKTRSLATKACALGRVHWSGQCIKPSKEIRIGDVLTIRFPGLTRTVRVVGLLERRVSAKEVVGYLEDLTPASEYERAREIRGDFGFIPRPQGAGRPTKKDRRALDSLE